MIDLVKIELIGYTKDQLLLTERNTFLVNQLIKLSIRH